jgi:zinc protease
MMAGTKKHDRQALREELETLGVRISPGQGGFGGGRGPRGGGGGGGGGALGQLTFSIEAKRETLPKAIMLLGEILREPSFPEAEFDTMRRGGRAGMSNATTDPTALANNALQRALSRYPKDDVRYVPTLEESQARTTAVTLEQVKALYESQIGAGKVELAVVGEFDPVTTFTQVKEILRGWESKVPVRRIERTATTDIPGAKQDIITPDKANAVFLAAVTFPLKESDPEYAALRLGNFILGGGTLSSRLGDRIRQKEGLSYGVTSSFTASPRDSQANLTINAITNPANIDKVEKAAMEELTRFLAEGPTESEVADAKKAFLEAQKVARTGDAGIAGQIVANLNMGRKFAHTAELEKQIMALSPEDIAAAFRKHVDVKKLVIVRAGDFKK